MAQREKLGLAPGQLPRWSLPLIVRLDAEQARFSALRDALRPITPRALSLTLKQMLSVDLVDRALEARIPADRDLRPHRPGPGAGGGDALGRFRATMLQDVAVRVLEPGDLHALADMDVAVALQPFHVVMFEGDALGLSAATSASISSTSQVTAVALLVPAKSER